MFRPRVVVVVQTGSGKFFPIDTPESHRHRFRVSVYLHYLVSKRRVLDFYPSESVTIHPSLSHFQHGKQRRNPPSQKRFLRKKPVEVSIDILEQQLLRTGATVQAVRAQPSLTIILALRLLFTVVPTQKAGITLHILARLVMGQSSSTFRTRSRTGVMPFRLYRSNPSK